MWELISAYGHWGPAWLLLLPQMRPKAFQILETKTLVSASLLAFLVPSLFHSVHEISMVYFSTSTIRAL